MKEDPPEKFDIPESNELTVGQVYKLITGEDWARQLSPEIIERLKELKKDEYRQ